jgi:alkylation response protein AidB-like acyl-CoA dehydrogenase
VVGSRVWEENKPPVFILPHANFASIHEFPRGLAGCLALGDFDWTRSAMSFLRQERATLEKVLPGLDAALAGIPLMEMERPGNPSIPVFRQLGGPGLLIPAKLGGRGASPLEAARAQRAIASRAPSLAVATTMHQFTIASFSALVLD